jgi:putative PIN family toxin of toxin-antitoxin system
MRRRPKKPTVVIDTNLLVSGIILKRGAPFDLLEAWRQRRYTLLVSRDQRTELRTVLQREKIRERYRITDDEIAAFFDLMDTDASLTSLRRRLPVHVRDPKDDHILAAALGGKADFLITGDGDLLALRDEPHLKKLTILTVREFLDLLPPL